MADELLIAEFKTPLIHDPKALYPYQLYVPNDVVAFIKEKKFSRLLVQFNQELSRREGLISGGGGKYFIKVNKESRDRLGLNKGDLVEVSLRPDTSQYGMNLPPEMKELLNEDPLFDQYFHALTPGKQRALIHLIDKLKSPEKRIQKAIIIAQHLIGHRGTLDFKQLHQDFRNG